VIGAASRALWLVFILIVSFYVITDAHLMYWSVVSDHSGGVATRASQAWRELVDIWGCLLCAAACC
jgi:hypothetical protein